MSRLLPVTLLMLCCRGEKAPLSDVPGDSTDTDRADTGERADTVGADLWLRDEQAAPGPVTFTELMYNAPDGEWLELHNPMVLDMDLSGWSLEGGVSFTFADGTVLPAGGYLVVSASPGKDALGPYDGALSDSGERITLRSRSGRLIDTVEYGEDDPWPVAADGSGLSLSKASPTAASDHAESWTVSAVLGGTPGAANQLDPLKLPTTQVLVTGDATWRYDTSGDYPADDWAQLGFDDSGWTSGTAPFYFGGAEGDVAATAWATADNYFALYLGRADGSGLRLVGEDTDGSWTTVEEVDLDLDAEDHLFLAAWELTGDATSPQMTIAEVELPDDTVGTNASDFEWVLGPPDTNPGALPTNAPPTAGAVADLIESADADGSWELPSVEYGRTASPWGASVSGAFTDAAMFIWGDTFSSDSVTNAEDTYALFRSIDPLLGPGGSHELPDNPTTTTFRTTFSFEGRPASTDLYLDCTLDDGAIFYLNGVEVLRENMPEGKVSATTTASEEIVDGVDFSAEVSSAALVSGENVLAVEVHQATVEDLDMAFGCALTAESWSEAAAPTILLNEVDPSLWVELLNVSATPQDIEGLRLTTSAGDEVRLSGSALESGGLRTLEDLGLSADSGDVLFLYDDDVVLDAVRVGEALRGRADGGGPWRFPSAATPGAANDIVLHEDVVINELQYHHATTSEEWIELYNRGESSIDLSGWRFVDAVAYLFPEGTRIAPGGYLVVDGFTGRLGNSGERILLLDAAGNPADEVRYFDGGRWPGAADGGGSSLELRDPWADNAAAEAWAASDEVHRTEWTWTTIRGTAEASAVGPDGVWEELVLGLLDGGEVLIDDLSVVRDPETDPVELLQDGSFDDAAASWRLLGNHRHSEVVADPDDPGNPVLRLVATGPTGHMHNHAETTLTEPIGAWEYEVSFRSRWISGSNQLLSRLYFNRLPQVTLAARPELSGTPGEENSTAADNIGPTFRHFGQDVAVPRPGEAVLVSVVVDDPDGVDDVVLLTSRDGDAFEELAMVEGAAGRWSVEVAGQGAGVVTQLYAEATDGLGAVSTFPAAGPDSRALYTVDDGRASVTGLHNLRILMTPGDADWLHEDVNLMSNDRVGATVVYNESEVFYDVGVRLKGSQRGRPTSVRLGYGVRFHDEQLFRGSHSSVLIDRSEGVGFGQREVLLNLAMTRAGLVSGEHNDLIQLISPRSEHVGSAELQLDRFSDLVLDAQFVDGADGTRFEYELIYYPTTTDDGTAEGLKLPQPDSVMGTAITDLGDEKEAYRWNYLIKNNQDRDDYDAIIALCQASSGSLEQVEAVIDVEQWLQAFAFATLSGATDQYGGAGSQHNAQLYVRPEDGRVLFFPHDLDYFFSSPTSSVVANSDLTRLLTDPVNLRSYYGHLNDIVESAYSSDYLAPWCAQLGALLPGQDFDAHCAFVDDRADWVMNGSSESVASRFPDVAFEITSAEGAGLEATVEGQAWVDVRAIALEGEDEPLEIIWLDEVTWQATVPLEVGDNALSIVATDLHGEVVGTDSVVVVGQ